MFNINEKINLSGYTFVIPCVSTGNVGQLTIDIMIATWNMRKLGSVWHKSIMPVYGPNPFDDDKGENCTACELFISEKYKCVAMQLRSTIDPQFVDTFLLCLKHDLQENHIKRVVILTSSFSYEQHDMESGAFRYFSNCTVETFKNAKVPLFDFKNQLVVHGGGYVLKLYDVLNVLFNVTVLIKYTTEGDNREDGISMFKFLKQCLGVQDFTEIKCPPSWNLMYGNPPQSDIYTI